MAKKAMRVRARKISTQPIHFVINEYIEMVLEKDKPVIYIAGKPVAYCSFLVVSLPEDAIEEIFS